MKILVLCALTGICCAQAYNSADIEKKVDPVIRKFNEHLENLHNYLSTYKSNFNTAIDVEMESFKIRIAQGVDDVRGSVEEAMAIDEKGYCAEPCNIIAETTLDNYKEEAYKTYDHCAEDALAYVDRAVLKLVAVAKFGTGMIEELHAAEGACFARTEEKQVACVNNSVVSGNLAHEAFVTSIDNLYTLAANTSHQANDNLKNCLNLAEDKYTKMLFNAEVAVNTCLEHCFNRKC